MKKTDLKQLIKPLVKECIHEVLIEEGLLSSVVSEVAKGMQGNMVTEARPRSFEDKPFRENKTKETNKRMSEQRKKMMDAIGNDSYNGVNLFEGTTPMDAGAPAPGTPDMGSSRDAGVDISSLVGGASAVWKAMK